MLTMKPVNSSFFWFSSLVGDQPYRPLPRLRREMPSNFLPQLTERTFRLILFSV
jgi:hypothetical protein